MPIKVVVGAQWGDEGKGKMVDYLSQNSDLTVRFQGGDNAGHTVINEYGIFKFHIVPCGIFNRNCTCLVGTGMVVNPDVLLEEIDALESMGIYTKNLKISSKAHLIMPYCPVLDGLMEKSGGIGTTKRGIGQTYCLKALRKNIRFEDLKDIEYAKTQLEAILPFVNSLIKFYGGDQFTVDDMVKKCDEWYKKLGDRIVDPVSLIHKMIDEDKNILFEGQLGAMKDIDLGIYPYVTSSNPVAAYAAVSGGFSPKLIKNITGIAKAFSSAVGDGPFPTEMGYVESASLRGDGDKPDDEYGARTGRARRLGWLDIPILKYANTINGFDELVLCKVDKLDDMPKIKICVAYELDGEIIDEIPNTKDLYRVKPIYEMLDGWMSSTKGIKKISALPQNAQKYIKCVEDLVGVKISYVGNGPEREDVASI
jgi:adenylosuccinate synthase